MSTLPEGLPLGIRQRLSLAVAAGDYKPNMLILDEPTSASIRWLVMPFGKSSPSCRARTTRHHLRLDPLYERGRAL